MDSSTGQMQDSMYSYTSSEESPEPLVLGKNEVKTILADSGVANERLSEFDRHYDETAGESTPLLMNNVMETRAFERHHFL